MDAVDQELAAVGAVLLEDRLLRRLIKHHRGLSGLGLQVPHAHGYALPKAALATLVEPGQLPIELAGLPDRVALIPGHRGRLAAGQPSAWLAAWRAIFHAHVHHALEELCDREVLTPAVIRQRINTIGQTEFDEARLVLQQEDLLLPPDDDTGQYVEFVALFLELRHFAPRALAQTFPILNGTAAVDAVVALDLDAAAVLAASRPARAPAQPVVVPPAPPPPAPRRSSFPGSLGNRLTQRMAAAARARGNHARAAILAARAGDAAAARGDLDALVARLGKALGDAPTTGWAEALAPVAEAAASQATLRYTASARLLLDLQAACVDGERDLEVVDAVAWARSLGKRSIIRTLPATREIRVARRVRAATKKIARCDLRSADDHDRLADAVHAMVERANHNVRTVLRPKIEDALDLVKLRPRHLPGRVAQKKLVDELLDQAVAVGRLSIGNLRDVISANDLKLPDLRPTQLVVGDQLLRADKLLARSLDGVYRRGEFYLRALQKLSSILSGNPVGRLLSLYLLLPLVGSVFIVEGLQHMVAPVAKAMHRGHPEISTRPVLLGTAAFIFLLLHVAWFRHQVVRGARAVGRGVGDAIGSVARRIWRVPLVRPVTRWLLLPALPAALAVWLIDGVARWPVGAGLVVVGAVLINSSVAEELISDWLLRSGRQLSRHILPGLVKYALELFGWLGELFERAIYRVDEALRFRPHQSQAMAVVKGVLGTLWFVVSYFLRLYVNLFVEPTVNPVKHFPVVTVAAKLILPFTPQMIGAITDSTSPVLGPTLGASFAAFTVLVLPGIAGFLAWELNSNWKLYERNRTRVLRPVAIGSHGESMGGLLRLGFHSGTVPKLHAKLRRATWKHNERAMAKHKEALHHAEEAVGKFVHRQLVVMLNEDVRFRPADVEVRQVELASNRVRIELVCPSVAATPAVVDIEEQSGWLVAGVREAGWLAALDTDHRRVVELALAGFYKLAAVDVVREQLEAVLASAGVVVAAYDLADDGLVVWPGPGFETEIIYDLESPSLTARVRGPTPASSPPSLGGQAAVFGAEPITWRRWLTTWDHLAFGMDPAPLVAGPSLLPAAIATPR
ncbi:MAG: hypothetical protein R3B06_07475 [Kofleriaceae bacterium]